ncbi:MAG: TonB-dependent receptor [Bacteroidales bacterium]|nr:TonB-dependent receptor [Bacteroidales bacterium]
MTNAVRATYFHRLLLQACIPLLFVTLFSFCSYGQPVILDATLTMKVEDKRLESVLEEIEQATAIKFSYSSNRIPVDSKISLEFHETPMYEVLDRLFDNLPVQYELMDEYIILKKGKVHHAKTTVSEDLKYSFHGYIRDIRTGESLIGAAVYIPETGAGAITNNYGYFTLTLKPASYTVQVMYLGYEESSLQIDLINNMKFDIQLRPAMKAIEEVTISSLSKEDIDFKRVSSQSEVIPEQVKKLPALFGESDVLKNLELQAGINYYGDASSYFNVRGGHYDQNLILLDEATLYNPSHLLGLFSPIIPDAVKSVDIYKSGFPAEYGGRLSSVIDIHTRDGNMNKFSGSGSIGIISARLSLEGPISKGKSSYFFAFRRSYFDALMKPLVPNLMNLFFHDFTGKLNLRMGPRDRLFITLYRGSDVFSLKEQNDRLGGLDWVNNSTTIRWNHILGSQTFMNVTLYGSLYDYYLRNTYEQGSFWNSRINNISLKEEISYIPTPRFTLKFGTQLGAYGFNPGNFTTTGNLTEVHVSPVKSLEGAIFIAAEHEILPGFAAQYGLRYVVWNDMGESFIARFDEDYELTSMDYYMPGQKFFVFNGFEPRLALSAKVAGSAYLKMSYCRTHQFINLINNSESPFSSFEVWLPAGPNILPQRADIYDLGFVKRFGKQGLSLQTGIFWKDLKNQIAYVNHANMIVNQLLEGELRQGDGYAYGFELSMKKESQKLNVQVAYTYLRSFLQIDGINKGEIYPAKQDRPHTLNLSFSYQLKPRMELTGSLNIGSGARISTPTSFYYYRGYQLPVYPTVNNDQMPPYSRIDLAAIFQLNKNPDRYRHSLTFAVYNLLADQNPIFLYYNKINNGQGDLLIPADQLKGQSLTTTIRYTFIILPSITYQFSF